MHHNHLPGQQIKIQNWVYASNELSQQQHAGSYVSNQQITQQQEQQQYTQLHPKQQQQVQQPQNNAISRSWDFKDSNNRSEDIKKQLPLLKKLLHMDQDLQSKIYAEQNSVQNCSSAQNIRSDDENFKNSSSRSQNTSESYQQFERNMMKQVYGNNQAQDSQKEYQWASNNHYEGEQVPMGQGQQQPEQSYENDDHRNLAQEYDQEDAEAEEEVMDFKEQIERNYNRSVANKIYSFPRQIDSDWSGFESDQTNSLTNSLVLYDLNQQNVAHHYNSSQQTHKNNNSNTHQHSQTLQSLQDYIQDTIHTLIANHMPTKQNTAMTVQQQQQHNQQQLQYFSQRQQNPLNPYQPLNQQEKHQSSEGLLISQNIPVKSSSTQISNQASTVDPQVFVNSQKNNQIAAQQIDGNKMEQHLTSSRDNQNQQKQLVQGYQDKKGENKRLKTEGYADFVEDEGVIQSIGLFAEKEEDDDSELSEDVARIPDKQYEYLAKDQVNNILEKCVSTTDEKTSQSVRTSTIKGNSSNKSSVVHQSLKDTVISSNTNNTHKLWMPPTSNSSVVNNNGNLYRSNHKNNMNNATMSILSGKQHIIGNDLSHKRLQVGMANKTLNKSVPIQQSNALSQQSQVVQQFSQQGTAIGNMSDHQQVKSKKRKVNLLESMLMDTMKIQNKTENQAEMKVTLQPRLLNNNNINNNKSREGGGGVSTSLNFNSISEMILSREDLHQQQQQNNHSSQTTKKIFQTALATTTNQPALVNSQIIPSIPGGFIPTIANKRCETPSQQISAKHKDNSALKTQKSRDINSSTSKQTNRQIKPTQQQQQQSLLRNTRLKTESSHPSSSAMGNYTVISERHEKSRERISSGSKPKRANNNSATLLTAETNNSKGIQKSFMPCAAEKFKKEPAKSSKLQLSKQPQIKQNFLNGNTQACNVQNGIITNHTNGSASKSNNCSLRPPVPSQHNYNSNHQLFQKPQQASQVAQLLDGYQQLYHKQSQQQQQQQHLHHGSASPDILIKQYLSENAKEPINSLNFKRFHTEDDGQSNLAAQKSLEKKKYEQEIMKAHLLRQLALKYVQKIPVKQQQPQQQQQFLKKLDSSQAPLQDIRSSYSSETIWMDRNLTSNQRALTEPSCADEQVLGKTAKTNAIISKAKPKLSALLLRDLPLPSKKEIASNNSNVSFSKQNIEFSCSRLIKLAGEVHVLLDKYYCFNSSRNKSSVRMRGQEQGKIKIENHNISKSSSRDNSRNRSQLQNALLQQQFQLK